MDSEDKRVDNSRGAYTDDRRAAVRWGPAVYAVGIGIRAASIGGVLAVVVWLVLTTTFYATAVVLGLFGFVLLADLARATAKSDRLLARFVEGLAAGETQSYATATFLGFQRFTDAIPRAVRTLAAMHSALRHQIETLQTLADTVPVVLIVLKADGAIKLVNRAAQRFAGRSVGTLDDIPQLPAEAIDQIRQLQARERTVLRLASGQRVLASASRLVADGEESTLLALQTIDMELDRVELKAWQDLARVLGHEMMNSMTPIVSLAESVQAMLLQGPAHSADIAAALDAIARRSAGLMRFVDRYRMFADVPEPILQPLPLGPFVARFDSLMSGLFAEKRIVYKSGLERPDLAVLADADLLEQALINLVKNAADAVADSPAPEIVLSCATQGDMVAISVADNGCGVDAAAREQIFVPFYSTKRGGSGIGLSLTRRIILLHQGRIEFEDRKPAGSLFTLLLPASDGG